MFDLVIINDNLDKAYATLKQALSEVGPSPPALWGQFPAQAPLRPRLTPVLHHKQLSLCQLPDWSSTGAKSKSPWGPGEDMRPRLP